MQADFFWGLSRLRSGSPVVFPLVGTVERTQQKQRGRMSGGQGCRLLLRRVNDRVCSRVFALVLLAVQQQGDSRGSQAAEESASSTGALLPRSPAAPSALRQ